jgi:hypothetical protein
MRQRTYYKGTKIVSRKSQSVTFLKHPSDFIEGRIKAKVNELGINVREYTKMAQIRLEMRLMDKGLITI